MNFNDILEYEKLNKEYHIPGYNFCGPGTKVYTRLKKKNVGINKLDEACKCHDIEYLMYIDNPTKLQEADQKLRNVAKTIGSISSWAVDNVFKLKRWAEDKGLITPTGFAMSLAKKLSIEKQKKLGELLYKKYILKENIEI
jgi:hypothetical protein